MVIFVFTDGHPPALPIGTLVSAVGTCLGAPATLATCPAPLCPAGECKGHGSVLYVIRISRNGDAFPFSPVLRATMIWYLGWMRFFRVTWDMFIDCGNTSDMKCVYRRWRGHRWPWGIDAPPPADTAAARGGRTREEAWRGRRARPKEAGEATRTRGGGPRTTSATTRTWLSSSLVRRAREVGQLEVGTRRVPGKELCGHMMRQTRNVD